MSFPALPVDTLRHKFGTALREHATLAPYTSARVGGPAEVLLSVKTSEELADAMQFIWSLGLPYFILGGGSNVLVSDHGIRGVVVLNRAKAVRFVNTPGPKVWAESGVVFSNLANRCAGKSLSGIEWASAVPGTIGGAVYGNAGAFEGDMSGSLLEAEILTESGRVTWPMEKLEYRYRSSILKRNAVKAVVLSAELKLTVATREVISAKMEKFALHRTATQPHGASLGSMFKNPPGDFAGRLIEIAGLKGARLGNAQISTQHANFFINHGKTSAADIRDLIDLARKTVKEKCGVELQLEIELLGEW